jgi:hypothetical protein
MQYKMILAILLLPVVSFGNQAKVGSVASSIESLKREKDIMECRAAQLGAKIIEEQDKLMAYRERVFTLLCDGRDNRNKEIMSRERFNSFVLQLCGVFAQGENINPLVEKAPFYRANTEVPMHLILKGLVVQQLFVKSLLDQYDQDVEDLRLLNKNLYQSSKN